jgi:hypothetical protein
MMASVGRDCTGDQGCITELEREDRILKAASAVERKNKASVKLTHGQRACWAGVVESPMFLLSTGQVDRWTKATQRRRCRLGWCGQPTGVVHCCANRALSFPTGRLKFEWCRPSTWVPLNVN